MKSNKVISKIVASTLLCSMVGYTLPVFAYTKDETVYSKLDSEGKNYKTIVSTHIENSEYADTINDMSDLLNIKNTSGDETYPLYSVRTFPSVVPFLVVITITPLLPRVP